MEGMILLSLVAALPADSGRWWPDCGPHGESRHCTILGFSHLLFVMPLCIARTDGIEHLSILRYRYRIVRTNGCKTRASEF